MLVYASGCGPFIVFPGTAFQLHGLVSFSALPITAHSTQFIILFLHVLYCFQALAALLCFFSLCRLFQSNVRQFTLALTVASSHGRRTNESVIGGRESQR